MYSVAAPNIYYYGVWCTYIGIRVSNIILFYIISFRVCVCVCVCVSDDDDNNIILYSNNNNYYNVTFRRRQVLSTLSRLYVHYYLSAEVSGLKMYTHTQKILY